MLRGCIPAAQPGRSPVKRVPMKRVIVSLTAGLVLALAGATIGGRAQAAAIAPAGLRPAADQLATLDKIQFTFRGRRFCWYPNGWRGSGWYWCGYRLRRGRGWGGPRGWHGWRVPGHRPGIRPPIGNVPGHRPGHRPGIRPPIGHVPGHRPGGHRRGHNAGAQQPGGSGAGANQPSGSGPGGRGRGGNS